MWRRPRTVSVLAYKSLVRKLLSKHGLRVPESTADMLTRTVTSCRRGWKPNARQAVTRQRLGGALTHAEALIRYTKKAPARAESTQTRSESLRDALNSLDAVVWLGVAVPRIDVPSLLDRLDTGSLEYDELTRLAQAITRTLSVDDGPTGRPMERSTAVVRAGCIAWFRAHRKDSYNTWSSDFSTGPLPRFLRDLLNCCWLYLSSQALYSATKDARRDIRNRHPRIAF